LGIVAYNPPLVNYLPQRVILTAETAPPPLNPKLQQCVEGLVFEKYQTNGNAIRAAITEVKNIDYSMLPKKTQKSVTGSFENAEKTFALVDDIKKTEADIETASGAYRPLHRKVREIEARILAIDNDVRQSKIDARRTSGTDDRAKRAKAKIEAHIAELEAEKKAIQANIPAAWAEERKKFVVLLNADKKARSLYRRNVDEAYEPIKEITAILAATDAYAALKPEIEGLRSIIESSPFEEAAAKVAAVRSNAGSVAGARKTRSALAKVRRALRGRSPDKQKAQELLDKALADFDAELTWRKAASAEVLPKLSAYEEKVRNTIGLRQQPRLPKTYAIDMASCLANHRDVSLQF